MGLWSCEVVRVYIIGAFALLSCVGVVLWSCGFVDLYICGVVGMPLWSCVVV